MNSSNTVATQSSDKLSNINSTDLTKVFYHRGCNDGYMAATIVYDRFNIDNKSHNLSMVDISHNYRLKDVPVAKVIMILDVSMHIDDVVWMLEEGKVVIWIDHHASNENIRKLYTTPNYTGVFDLEKSGALLTWEYVWIDVPAPVVVKLVSDRDLWKFKYNNSKAMYHYLKTIGYSNHRKVWADLLSCRDKKSFDSKLVIGRMVKGAHDRKISEICLNKHPIRINGYVGVAVNAGYGVASDVGAKLSLNYKFAAIYRKDGNGNTLIDLRSCKDSPGCIDVSKLAKRFGGGGHKHAGGFRITNRQLFWNELFFAPNTIIQISYLVESAGKACTTMKNKIASKWRSMTESH